MAVPPGDLRLGATPPVDHDEAGTRFSYVMEGDKIRLVYLVGENLYVAPPGAVHAAKAPPLGEELGALFEAAGDKRARLVADVRATLGEEGLAKMLASGADVDAPEWASTYASLPPPRAAEVQRALATSLEPGKPTRGIRRAVALVPLAELAKTPGFATRVAEEKTQLEAPRAAGVMLRALARADAPRAAEIACAALGRAKASGGEDPEGHAILVEGASLAIAHAGATCAAIAPVLLENACSASVRCGPNGPLGPRDASKQDEPLCTKEQLAAAVEQELARPPTEVAAGTSGTRVALFAYAALAKSEKELPEAFVRAHARRRYPLTQPESPPCDAVATGEKCHCEEAVVRDQACRNEGGGLVRVGLCAFQVDDKQKRIRDVVASPPP